MINLLCPYCGEKAELCSGDKIYQKRPDLYELKFWQCEPCDARVGTHKGTTDPLGRLANKQLRFLKIQAHSAFDPIWRDGNKKRNEAYAWLASKMNIKQKDCHIGMMDAEQCKQVVRICAK